MKYYWAEKVVTILITTAIVLTALVCLYRITYDGYIRNTNKIIHNFCQNNGDGQNYVNPPSAPQAV
jgi:hypothetical protein